jgi:DNA-binding transcriptional LysR family regulator
MQSTKIRNSGQRQLQHDVLRILGPEDELGTPLFKRTSRRVTLTEAGVLFRVEAETNYPAGGAGQGSYTARRARWGRSGTDRLRG